MSGKAGRRRTVEMRRLVSSDGDKRGRDISFCMKTKIDLFILLLLTGYILAADHVLAVGNDRGSEKINIAGEDSEMGVYDPSVEYDDDGIGWLAYTAMSDFRNPAGNEKVQLETHLAKSFDHGRTWTKVGRANSGLVKTLTLKGKPVQAVYRNETPTLLYDPHDPDSNRRWKLFTVRGFISAGNYKNTQWPYVHIAYKYAASPEGLSSAKEILLFGSQYCKPPVCSVKFNLNDFSPDLKNVVFYEEPGSLVKDGVIYLTLSAVIGRQGQKTILLSSQDHGETWKYKGILTFRKDAENLGFNELTSSSLAQEDGRVFLLVSPVKAVKLPRHLQYNGVYIFEFVDISKGILKRDAAGELIVIKYLPSLSTRSVGGGQSEYNEQNTYGGIIMAQSDINESCERFKIFNTGQDIVE